MKVGSGNILNHKGIHIRDIYAFDSLTAVAVGDLGTVIKTTDGGLTWDVNCFVGGTNRLTSVHFINRNIGWIVAGKIILTTGDGGKNWGTLYSDSTNTFNSVYFVNPDTGWIVGYGIIIKTTDGGKNWSEIIIREFDDVPNLTAITFITDQTGWIVGNNFYGNPIYKTTDGGESWYKLNDIEPIIYHLTDMQLLNKNFGYVLGPRGKLLKTSDGGNTWEYKNINKEKEELYLTSVFFTDTTNGFAVGEGYINNLAYDELIIKTTNSGNEWAIINKKRQNHDENSITLNKVRFAKDQNSNNYGWIIGQDGIIYKTHDSGNNWIKQREDKYNLRSIYFINESTGWAVGNHGSILSTKDGGIKWNKQNINDSIIFYSVYSKDNLNNFAVGTMFGGIPLLPKKAIIVKTTNDGLTWNYKLDDSVMVYNSIIFVNDSIGWIGGSGGTLLKTTDKGNSWNKVKLDEIYNNSTINKIQFININTGWISLYRGNYLLKTIDGGKSWTEQTIDSNLIMYSFHFANEKDGWAVGAYNSVDNIYKTSDGGNSWISEHIIRVCDLHSVFFINENLGWTAGYDYLNGSSVIFQTTNGGEDWYEQKSPCINEGGLSNIFIINENTGWAVGNGIIKTTNGGGIVNVSNEKELYNTIPNQIELFQNYPNPFNPTTTIKYAIPQKSDVEIIIYDIMGREVKTLVKGNNGIGYKEVIWDGRNNEGQQVSSGIYICRIKATSLEDLSMFEKSIKLLLMK
jgi:photosystem II stability/assembly factor-like uncharacterized protein